MTGHLHGRGPCTKMNHQSQKLSTASRRKRSFSLNELLNVGNLRTRKPVFSQMQGLFVLLSSSCNENLQKSLEEE